MQQCRNCLTSYPSYSLDAVGLCVNCAADRANSYAPVYVPAVGDYVERTIVERGQVAYIFPNGQPAIDENLPGYSVVKTVVKVDSPKPEWWPFQDKDVIFMNETNHPLTRINGKWYYPGNINLGTPSVVIDDEVSERVTMLIRDKKVIYNAE